MKNQNIWKGDEVNQMCVVKISWLDQYLTVWVCMEEQNNYGMIWRVSSQSILAMKVAHVSY